MWSLVLFTGAVHTPSAWTCTSLTSSFLTSQASTQHSPRDPWMPHHASWLQPHTSRLGKGLEKIGALTRPSTCCASPCNPLPSRR